MLHSHITAPRPLPRAFQQLSQRQLCLGAIDRLDAWQPQVSIRLNPYPDGLCLRAAGRYTISTNAVMPVTVRALGLPAF